MSDRNICSAAPRDLRAETAAIIEGLLRDDATGLPTWYVWGGSGSLERGLDCSGLVVWLARKLGVQAPRWNTDRIFNELERVDVPQPGDLAVYGRGIEGDPASHVMFCVGPSSQPQRHPGLPPLYRVAGMSGGGSKTTSIEIAKQQGARLKAFESHLYRKDFIGWRRLPFVEDEP